MDAMQLDQLEAFLELCDTRHFGRAAERLGVAQSTVSARLQALEAALGCRLMTRARAGTALTTEGLRFEPHARALRYGWAEALHATRAAATAVTLRIGIQHDLAAGHVADWIAGFRATLPDTGFYIETDYSIQMCSDLASGSLDLAVLYSPRAHPDLHFDPVGEVRYCMVSTRQEALGAIKPARYVMASYSPAFAQIHASRHPGLSATALGAGQNAAVASLILATQGAGYVLEETARMPGFHPVPDVPPIMQTVFSGVHLRNRTRGMHQRLTRRLRSTLGREFHRDAP